MHNAHQYCDDDGARLPECADEVPFIKQAQFPTYSDQSCVVLITLFVCILFCRFVDQL